VIGYGRIGRRAAGLFAGLGFRVLANDAFAPISAPAQAASLDELLEASHIVSLHAPGDPSGAPLLGVAELGRMREGAVLVNTSRGSLIDVAALVAGLRAGRPGTAALDVFAGEPPDLAVFAPVLDHLVLTPHMAWYTEESERILRQKAAAAVHRLLTGQRPDDVVVEGAALTEVTA
jgi:phosphoglycerate dehydrogenase-like enzyme